MAIDLTPEAFHAAGYRAVDHIAALLESLPQRPVVPEREPSIIRTQLGNGLPEEGMDPEELVDWIAPPSSPSTRASDLDVLIDEAVSAGRGLLST